MGPGGSGYRSPAQRELLLIAHRFLRCGAGCLLQGLSNARVDSPTTSSDSLPASLSAFTPQLPSAPLSSLVLPPPQNLQFHTQNHGLLKIALTPLQMLSRVQRTRRTPHCCSFFVGPAGPFGIPCAHAVTENCRLCCPEHAESAAHRIITVQFASMAHRASLVSSPPVGSDLRTLQRPLQCTQRNCMSSSAELGVVTSSRGTV